MDVTTLTPPIGLWSFPEPTFGMAIHQHLNVLEQVFKWGPGGVMGISD